MPSDLEIVPFVREHLPAVIELFAAEGWSYAQDDQRTWRALTAPGSLSLVALCTDQKVVGIAQVLSDGEIQAFLATLVVAKTHRRRGVAGQLVQQALARTRCIRLDVISCADPFYERLGFNRLSGFRLRPEGL